MRGATDAVAVPFFSEWYDKAMFCRTVRIGIPYFDKNSEKVL